MNAAPRRQGIPLIPSPDAVRTAGRDSYLRAVTASVLAKGQRDGSPLGLLRRAWPNDRDAELVLKAASSSAELGVPAWAGLLSMVRPADFISMLAPASCALALLQRCLEFEWPEGVQGLSIPAINVSAAKSPFVAEDNPTPVVSFVTSVAGPMVPAKARVIVCFTREILEYSLPNAELMVRTALSESLGLSMDTALFSTAAATTSTPAGIFNGISALPASTATIQSEAATEDIAALFASVSAVSGNHPVTLIASPKQFASLRARLDIGAFDVLPCSTLPANTLAAVASNGLASICDSVPDYTVADQMSLVMDTAPGAIGASGPAMSMFQQDQIAIRLMFRLTWALRDARAAAWVQGVSW
jgi:hypothetical protein